MLHAQIMPALILICLHLQAGSMELVPEQTSTHLYKQNDRIVVLADQEKADSVLRLPVG